MTDTNGKQPIRMTAEIEGDFVVFITGMRINKLWKVHQWWPNFRAMRKVLMALFGNEEYGALGAHAWWNRRGPLLIGYFRDIEKLEAFANDRDQPHAQAWQDYFRRMKNNGDVGVWHETYVVRSGEYEAAYDYMPGAVGLAAATAHVPIERRGDLAHQRRATGARAAARAAAAAADGTAQPGTGEAAVPAGANGHAAARDGAAAG